MSQAGRRFIVVRTQFEAMHQWADAPDEVAFLRDLHRHVFHVELKLEVYHADRELEFILVKRALTKWLELQRQPVGSCEMIAEQVLDWAERQYGEPRNRGACCTVSEDGENGALAFNEKW